MGPVLSPFLWKFLQCSVVGKWGHLVCLLVSEGAATRRHHLAEGQAGVPGPQSSYEEQVPQSQRVFMDKSWVSQNFILVGCYQKIINQKFAFGLPKF